ncbi:MAG TPA: hypothetical protein VH589_21230 [Trebonia sp.]|jgi:hypothetical protein
MRYRGAGSRRQPKRPPSDPGPDAAAWDDGSRGYGHEDAYPPAGEYDGYDGYAPDGSQPGYGGYGNDGFGDAGRYGQGGGYGYPQGDGYGGVNPSGGYPTTGNGADPHDVPGRYAGNDWYGRPNGASGSGFADTGTYNMDRRSIEAYGTGPRPAPRPANDQYQSYPGYPGQGEYQDELEYGDPQGYAQGGYGQDYEEPGDYADDPYRDPYGDDGTAPRPPGKGGKPKKTKGGARRGKRRLLLAALSVVVVGVIAGAGYIFVLKPKPSPATSASTGPLPSPGSSAAAAAACVKKFGEYCHIGLRSDDPAPLTLAELYPPAFTNEADHLSFTRVGTKLDKTCSNAVIGQDLIGALQDGKCTQLLRASYVSGDNQVMGTIGVANLSSTNQAHRAGKFIGTNDFVEPLSTKSGAASKLGKGTGIVEAEFKGHYLILIWAEFTSTKSPATKAQDQQLQQFGTDLIAGTANISLSQRMVNGAPATAAASPG